MLYLSEIEEIFSKVRGVGLILSPLNWIIVERWEEMGIPLSVVSKGIKKSCKRLRVKERRVDVLTYCEPGILELWKEHKKKLVGAPGEKKEREQYEKTYNLIIKKISSIRKEFDIESMRRAQSSEIIISALSRTECGEFLKQIEKKNGRGFSPP